MKFCSVCGTIYTVDHKSRSYVCVKCGQIEPLSETILINRPTKDQEKVIVIGEKERKISIMPKTKIICPKCGNGEAYWWMVQTRSIDESSTQFYRCSKCGNTWREYS